MNYFYIVFLFLFIQSSLAMEQSPVLVANNSSESQVSASISVSNNKTSQSVDSSKLAVRWLRKEESAQGLDLISLENGEYTVAAFFEALAPVGDSGKKSAESPEIQRAQLHRKLCQASRKMRQTKERSPQYDQSHSDEVAESTI